MRRIKEILRDRIIYRIFLVVEITMIILYLILMYASENYAFNVTPSVPLGIYRIYRIKPGEPIKKGDFVIYEIPEELQNLTSLRNTDILSLKPVAATSDDIIEIKNQRIYINGEDYGKIISNKNIPVFNGKLNKEEVLTLSKAENTFDGRYYGGIRKDRIVGKARLVYEFK
ncbi:S26 family signal peptidase [Bacteroides heparinolyticus]|uniref:S26 family signal peptidase n=1 Tax=Prevotella heparinolytica TaxID=28113 RepID=UPI0035A04FDD